MAKLTELYVSGEIELPELERRLEPVLRAEGDYRSDMKRLGSAKMTKARRRSTRAVTRRK